MFRNRNGYWMTPAFFNLFPEGGEGAGTDAGAGDAGAGDEGGTGTGTGADGADSGAEEKDESRDVNAEIARLKADLAKQKAALDKATKEAGDARKELRKRQSAEEIAAEEKKAQEEKAAQEIEELRREVARTKAVKSVMSKLATDEEVSGKIAEYLYGAEDVDAALTEIQRAWSAKEKALRLEFGKIPGPGAGSGEDDEERKALELAKTLGKDRAGTSNSLSGLKSYMR